MAQAYAESLLSDSSGPLTHLSVNMRGVPACNRASAHEEFFSEPGDVYGDDVTGDSYGKGGSSETEKSETKLLSLCGSWEDTNGSTYSLISNCKGSIDVTTVRPSGKTMFTSSLIRAEAFNGVDEILFGAGRSSSCYVLSEYSGSSLLWKRKGAKSFDWKRVDSSSSSSSSTLPVKQTPQGWSMEIEVSGLDEFNSAFDDIIGEAGERGVYDEDTFPTQVLLLNKDFVELTFKRYFELRPWGAQDSDFPMTIIFRPGKAVLPQSESSSSKGAVSCSEKGRQPTDSSPSKKLAVAPPPAPPLEPAFVHPPQGYTARTAVPSAQPVLLASYSHCFHQPVPYGSWQQWDYHRSSADSYEEWTADQILPKLCGKWKDDKGSRYYLSRGCDLALDVTTTRPTGEERLTKGLIHIDNSSGPGSVVWGRSKSCFMLADFDGNYLKWRSSAGRCFRWTRSAQYQ